MMGKLALTRKLGETIMVGEIPVQVVRIAGGTVRLSIDAPREIPIRRAELKPHGAKLADVVKKICERKAGK